MGFFSNPEALFAMMQSVSQLVSVVNTLKNSHPAATDAFSEVADVFEAGEVVDVIGTSKGKGYAGAIKRHNQHRGPMAHGSKYHRGVGSLGSIAANRVFKGQTMAGRMGADRVTVQNLQVVRVDTERNLLLIKGSVPGPKNSYVAIRSAVKKKS